MKVTKVIRVTKDPGVMKKCSLVLGIGARLATGITIESME
jgi:hypothetical protein